MLTGSKSRDWPVTPVHSSLGSDLFRIYLLIIDLYVL
jgi:hypothetical protein